MQKDLDEFQSLAFSNRISVSDMLNFAGLKAKMSEAFKSSTDSVQINNVRIAAGRMAEINRELTHGIGVIDVLVKLVPDKSQLKGLSADAAIINATTQIQQQAAVIDQLNEKKEATRQLEREIALEAIRVGEAYATSDSMVGKFLSGVAASPHAKAYEADIARVKELRAETEKAATSASFGSKEYEELARKSVAAFSQHGFGTNIQFDDLARATRRVATHSPVERPTEGIARRRQLGYRDQSGPGENGRPQAQPQSREADSNSERHRR